MGSSKDYGGVQMAINRTFEDLLKDKITTDLANYILDRNVILTNDINLYAQRKDLVGNEIYGVMITANGDRLGGDLGFAVTKAVAIEFVVPLNFREDFLERITDYTNEESESTTQTLGNVYYFKANYNTPTCDGQVFNLNGKNYVTVQISGFIYYGEFALVVDSVSIASSLLKNIISSTKAATPNNESIEIAGLNQQLILTQSISDVKTFRIIYVGTDTLHATLRGYINNPLTMPNSVSVTINSNTYNAKMTLNEELVNGFATITITLQRTGSYV